MARGHESEGHGYESRIRFFHFIFLLTCMRHVAGVTKFRMRGFLNALTCLFCIHHKRALGLPWCSSRAFAFNKKVWQALWKCLSGNLFSDQVLTFSSKWTKFSTQQVFFIWMEINYFLAPSHFCDSPTSRRSGCSWCRPKEKKEDFKLGKNSSPQKGTRSKIDQSDQGTHSIDHP